MNVIMLLTPKIHVEYIFDDCSIYEGLEKIKSSKYTAIPVLSRDGKYVGTVSEGDFLWYLLEKGNLETSAKVDKISSIIRKDYVKVYRIDVSIDELLDLSCNQSFVPIEDDRDFFVGIVTRKNIIKNLLKNSK